MAARDGSKRRKLGDSAAAPSVQALVFDGRRVLPAAEHAAARRPAGGALPAVGAAPPAADAPLSERRRAFAAAAADVARFGASGLDAKSRKAWQEARLAALGVAPPPRPRIPANIGLGMARKAAQRAEAARLAEAAVNGGKLGPKKRAPAAKAGGAAPEGRRDRGVAYGAGVGDRFAGGVLRLAPAAAAAEPAPRERRGPGRAAMQKLKGRAKTSRGRKK